MLAWYIPIMHSKNGFIEVADKEKTLLQHRALLSKAWWKWKEELHNALKLQQVCLLQALQNNSPGNDFKAGIKFTFNYQCNK